MNYYGFTEVGPTTKEAEVACRSKKFNYYDVESSLKFLLGKVLTVVDATFSDQEQRKAMKDVVKGLFSESMMGMYMSATQSGSNETSK